MHFEIKKLFNVTSKKATPAPIISGTEKSQVNVVDPEISPDVEMTKNV